MDGDAAKVAFMILINIKILQLKREHNIIKSNCNAKRIQRYQNLA